MISLPNGPPGPATSLRTASSTASADNHTASHLTALRAAVRAQEQQVARLRQQKQHRDDILLTLQHIKAIHPHSSAPDVPHNERASSNPEGTTKDGVVQDRRPHEDEHTTRQALQQRLLQEQVEALHTKLLAMMRGVDLGDGESITASTAAATPNATAAIIQSTTTGNAAVDPAQRLLSSPPASTEADALLDDVDVILQELEEERRLAAFRREQARAKKQNKKKKKLEKAKKKKKDIKEEPYRTSKPTDDVSEQPQQQQHLSAAPVEAPPLPEVDSTVMWAVLDELSQQLSQQQETLRGSTTNTNNTAAPSWLLESDGEGDVTNNTETAHPVYPQGSIGGAASETTVDIRRREEHNKNEQDKDADTVGQTTIQDYEEDFETEGED